MGEKDRHLREAIEAIEKQIGNVCSLSAFYATEPHGFESANGFLNAALCVETTLTPVELLLTTQAIERRLGRTHKSTNGIYHDRVIDIDILLYDELVGTFESCDGQTLILPHPQMHTRAFVLEPLEEIAPQLLHPALGVSIQCLREQLTP